MAKREESKKTLDLFPESFLWSVDYVSAEQNLETIGYFSARYERKRAANDNVLSRTIAVSEGRRVEIMPSAKYGFPNAEDLDFYRAFLKICDERAIWVKVDEYEKILYHPQLPSPISFSSRELIAKAGRYKSHRELIAVRDWIERLSSTMIRGELFDAKAKRFDMRIGIEPVFKQFVHVGRTLSDGTRATQNYVWLAQWFIDNYFHFYSRPFDLKFHHRLKHAIAKTLYPLLGNAWFASNGAPYTKCYEDLCGLLDIKAHQHLSRVRHQLDLSNEELKREQFIAKYDYPLTSSGEWSGNIRWWPGAKWLYDQEHKNQKRLADNNKNTMSLLPSSQEELPLANGTPQLSLPLASRTQRIIDDPYDKRVRSFYTALGQSRPSREQVRAGVAVLQNLIGEQRYTWEEVDFTADWMVNNLERRFNGNIQSLGLMAHVIGEALKDKNRRERVQKKQKVQQDCLQMEKEVEVQRGSDEQEITKLSDAEQERLRSSAIKNLEAQGVKPRFMVDGLVKAEILRLFRAERESRV